MSSENKETLQQRYDRLYDEYIYLGTQLNNRYKQLEALGYKLKKKTVLKVVDKNI